MTYVQEATQSAMRADSAWSEHLKQIGLSRWHSRSKGEPGSLTRQLYDAKVLADRIVAHSYTVQRVADTHDQLNAMVR